MRSLAEFSLFGCLSPERVRAIEMRCRRRNYGEHDLIIDYDEPSTDVWFVLSGRIRVLARTPNGREFIFAELKDGDMFGELAAIDGRARSANVMALVHSQLLVMPASVFVDLATGTPEIAQGVLRILAERMRGLSVRLAEHAYLTARQRLYAEMLRLSQPRAGDPSQRIISPPPIQRDLANRIGSSREAVSRELAVLEKEGIVEKMRGGLVLLRPEELTARISRAGPDQ